MKLTITQPPPPAKTFHVELTELETQAIADGIWNYQRGLAPVGSTSDASLTSFRIALFRALNGQSNDE